MTTRSINPIDKSGFGAYVKAGFVDTFREFEPWGGHYTWWSNRLNARARNIGWRIDYFFVNSELAELCVDADIHQDVMGSDHCPVSLELDL